MRILSNVLLTFLLICFYFSTRADEIMCINFSAPEIEDASCNQDNGRIKVNHDGTAPFTYSWSHDASLNDSVAENLPPGTYMITVTDDAGCSSDITVIILEESFELTGTTIAAICGAPTGSASVNVTAGSGGTAPYTYQWGSDAGNQTTSTASGLSSGIYEVIVTDNDGCTSTLSLNVPANTNGFGASITSFTSPTCFGGNDGSARVSAVGGNGVYDFEWFLQSDPDSIVSTDSIATGLTGAIYIVRVTDPQGASCAFNTAVNLPNPPELVPNLVIERATGCRISDGEAFVNPTGGTAPYDILWSNGSTNDTISNLLADRYTVTVTDSNNCFREVNFWITTSVGPFFEVDTLQEDNCGLEEGIVGVKIETGQAPYQILWTTNDFNPIDTAFFAYNIARTDSGNPPPYIVTVIDADSCIQRRSFGMPGRPPLTVEDVQIKNNYCELGNGNATVTFSGGTEPYTYQWTSTPSQTTQTAFELIAGIYQVTVEDSLLCQLTEIVEIIDEPGFTISTTSTDETCYGLEDGTATVTLSGGRGNISYSWDSSPRQFTANATNLSGGVVNVFVTDEEGCVRKGFEIIESKPFLQTDFEYLPDTLGPVVLNQEFQFLERSEGGERFEWDFGDGNSSTARAPFHVYADTGRYFVTLTVSDSSGTCEDSRTYGPFIVQLDGVVYVPNAFTPNGDGFNDRLIIQGRLLETFNFHVYSRWGQEVYQSQSLNDAWDGRLPNGRMAPEGVYVYVLEAEVPGQNPIIQKGTITVIK